MKTATYDLIVIGSGPGGEKGAAQAAYFGKKVALIERAPRFGGAHCNLLVVVLVNGPGPIAGGRRAVLTMSFLSERRAFR